MIKKIYLIIGVLVIATAAGGVFYFTSKPTGRVACTMEAKLCPDGSYVGRTGPKCEFTPCPTPTTTSKTSMGTIKGKVTVGPICPVERLNSPCPVPPTAYTSREVILYAINGTTEIKKMHFTANGTYGFEVPTGTYIINTPQQGIGGSKDLPKTLTIKSGETIEFNFSIDTGIR